MGRDSLVAIQARVSHRPGLNLFLGSEISECFGCLPCMPVQNVKRSNSNSAKPVGLTDARRCRFDLDMKVCGPGPCSDVRSCFLDGVDGVAAVVGVLCSGPCNVPSVSEVDMSSGWQSQWFGDKN